METWPDLFEPEVTYVAYRRNLADFDQVIGRVLDLDADLRSIAEAGYNRYRLHTVALCAPDLFARHMKMTLDSQ